MDLRAQKRLSGKPSWLLPTLKHNYIFRFVKMSSKTEAAVIENATNHPERADRDKEENIDKSVLDKYMTDDNQVRAL